MTELETKLNNLLEEHQHESGLHMIGGRRRLIDRLVKFFEQDVKSEEKSSKTRSRFEN
jgi:16S rRNA G1207 methylase RsmC